MIDISLTALAERQLRALRSKRAQSAKHAINEIRSAGCDAAGYRLAGETLSSLCCRHLYSNDRLLTAWPTPDHAVIIVVGPHTRGPDDIYQLICDGLGITMPRDARTKPPCCDPHGHAPTDPQTTKRIAHAIEHLTHRHK